VERVIFDFDETRARPEWMEKIFFLRGPANF